MNKSNLAVSIDVAYSAALIGGFIFDNEIARNFAVFATWAFFVISFVLYCVMDKVAESMAEEGKTRSLPIWWHTATWVVVFGSLLPGGNFLLASISLFRLIVSETMYSKINDHMKAAENEREVDQK